MSDFKLVNYEDGKEMEFLKDFPVDDITEFAADHIRYTIRHKKAIIMTYMELTGLVPKLDSRLWLHDMEKVYLYYHLDNPKEAHNIHRKHSKHHHPNCVTLDDKKEAILDYECARITKPDKPRNALETIRCFYAETEDDLKPLLEDWGINSEERKDFAFDLYKRHKDYIEGTLYAKMFNCMKEITAYMQDSDKSFDDLAEMYSTYVAALSL